MLLLPEDQNAVLICVATGTGIAPYRSFWRRIFYEAVPNYEFTGLFWLFMGAANSDACLYDNEIQVQSVQRVVAWRCACHDCIHAMSGLRVTVPC